MPAETLYEKQYAILDSSKVMLSKENISLEDLKEEYSKMIDHYEDNVGEMKLIVKVSDKLQNKINRANESLNKANESLNKANDSLDKKNKELQDTLDALTKAKVGKKATTIVLLLGVFLFILEELFLEKMIEERFGANVWISIGAKFIIAILLKPIELFLENYLLNLAYTKSKGSKSS